jgi:hypothetical protein
LLVLFREILLCGGRQKSGAPQQRQAAKKQRRKFAKSKYLLRSKAKFMKLWFL